MHKNLKPTKIQFVSFFKRHWVYLFGLLGLVLLAYVNSLPNGFVSDDVTSIQKNPELGSPETIIKSFPTFIRPIFMYVTYHLTGTIPAFYRLWNIFFHFGTVCGLYTLTYILTRKKPLSFLTAGIFAVHPITTEGVAWISGGHYVQYSFFVIWSLVAYAISKMDRRFYWISFGLFLLGLMSYQIAIVLPILIVLYDLTFSDIKRNWKRYTPYFIVLAIGVIYFSFHIVARINTLHDYYFIASGYENPFQKIPFAVTKYLELLVVPLYYTLYHSETISMLEFVIRCIAFIIFCLFIWYAYKRDKILFFGLCMFLICLSPFLTPLRIASTVAERYAYLASTGAILAGSWILYRSIVYFGQKKYQYYIFSCIIIILMIRTIVRNTDWSDEFHFWSETAIVSANSAKVHNNLGIAWHDKGNLQEAGQEFVNAVQLDPNDADAHRNLGYVYSEANQLNLAEQQYLMALQIQPFNWQCYNDLGAVLIGEKKYKDAEQTFLKAIQINPRSGLVYANIAHVYFLTGNLEAAKQAMAKALQLEPTDPRVTKIAAIIGYK